MRKLNFTLLGLLVAFAYSLVALEWRFYEDLTGQLSIQLQTQEEVEELPPITQQEEVKTPPPPPAPQPTQIQVVENTKEEQEIASTEATTETKVEIAPPPPPPPPKEEHVEDPTIYVVVEEMPEFPGGEEALIKYIQSNIVYPQYAREAEIQGTVYVSFVVNEKGEVTDVKVLKGIGGGCDEEAVRVVKSLPKFKPGKQRGRPVKVQMRIPIKFILR